jgi:hypothetical protein
MRQSLIIDGQPAVAEEWVEGPRSNFAKLFKEPDLVSVGSARFKTEQPIATRQRVYLEGDYRIARVRGSVRLPDGRYSHKAVLFEPRHVSDAER